MRELDRTTSAPKSVLHYELDKVKNLDLETSLSQFCSPINHLWNSLTPKENKLFNSHQPSVFLFVKTRLGKGNFRIEVLTLVQLITENRLSHARASVHSTLSPLHI